jgi:hypothetical protein
MSVSPTDFRPGCIHGVPYGSYFLCNQCGAVTNSPVVPVPATPLTLGEAIVAAREIHTGVVPGDLDAALRRLWDAFDATLPSADDVLGILAGRV